MLLDVKGSRVDEPVVREDLVHPDSERVGKKLGDDGGDGHRGVAKEEELIDSREQDRPELGRKVGQSGVDSTGRVRR